MGNGSKPSPRVRGTILALFFLSGACGLVYEVVWMRMSVLIFGATAFAASTILAAFFAGLALGGFIFGKVADRHRNPLMVYAVLEAGIGVSALLMPLAFAGLAELYVTVARRFALGYQGLTLVRFAFSFVVLMVPTTLMGGTLPVMVRFFTRNGERLGWNVGRLYAVNTFGAVVGTVGAGFVLIVTLGVREATYAAAALNLLMAAVVFLLARRFRAVPEDPGAREGELAPEREPTHAFSPAVARLALWAMGISGLCALALEVLWTRALVFFLDNSTHAFTTMLTAFLLGIALGSAAVARFVDRGRRLVAWLGWIEVLIGVSAALAIPVIAHSTPVLERLGGQLPDALLYWKWAGLRFGTSLTVMLVPTVLMGMSFPLAVKIYTRSPGRVGRASGRVYAVNTLGGVVGSVAAGFALIPMVGLRDGILLVAAANILLGLVLVLAEPRRARSLAATTATAAVVVVLATGTFLAARGSMAPTSYIERMESTEVLAYEEGIGATVKVFRDAAGARYLSIDGFPVAGTSLGLHDAQKALGNIPMLLSPVDSPRVNLIGFGAGGASWGVLQYGASRVDVVELVPAVPRAAGWFDEVNHGVLDEPRLNLILGDGRNHALVSEEVYDVVAVDATSPKMAGNGSLYTLEFYRLLEKRLSPEGLVVQWLPIHLLSDAEVRMTARTFLQAYPHSTLWLSALRHHGILVGTREPLALDYQVLQAKMERAGVREELAPLRVTDAMDVLGWFVMGEERLAEYVGDARIHTDNHPYLEFTPAMAYFVARGYLAENLLKLQRARESAFSLLVNVGRTEAEEALVEAQVERRFEATQHSIRGDILFYLGRRQDAGAAYRKALTVDPREKNWAHPAWMGQRPPG